MSALPLAPLDAFLKDLELSLSDEQADLLSRFYELVNAANSRFNLTAVTDAEIFVTKHYIDSVSSADIFPAGAKILDLGAGAGLPSVPLAIVRPDIFVTALDATAKKVGFISSSAKALKLKNLTATAGRAEERGDLFSKFDFVTARAVTSLPALVELALPLLKTGGRLVAYKTPADDPKDAAHALVMCALGSKSDMCIIPVQDILGLDNSARMNVPSVSSGNWQFRLEEIPGRKVAAWLRKAVKDNDRL